MKNRMIAIVLAITMVLPICLTMGLSVGATGSISDFAGGSGTEDDPYLISTAEHLNNVRKQRGAYFEMINDVVFDDSDFIAGGAFYNSGKGWEPIDFYGTFDGNNYHIKNLFVNRPQEDYVGLFGTVSSNGKVKNVLMDNVSILGNNYVGGVCGNTTPYKSQKLEIEHCYVDGKVEGVKYVGGICGCLGDSEYASGNYWIVIGSSIKQCYNVASVNAVESYAGGIAGITENEGFISMCVNAGNISSNGDAGGIVAYLGGYTHSSKVNMQTKYAEYLSDLQNCINKGTVVGQKAGGIAVSQYRSTYTGGDHRIACSNSYNIGVVYGDTAHEIILAPHSYSNCYSTADDLTYQATFSDKWDFNTVWTMEGDLTYPYPELKCFTLRGKPEIKGDWSCSGTVDVDLSGISIADEVFVYRWYIDGTRVFEGETYAVQSGDVGKRLKLEVVSKHLFYAGSVFSQELIVEKTSDHTYGEWTQTKAPGCESNGTESRTCSVCTRAETRDVAATGHTMGEWMETKAPDCENDGIETRKCNFCSKEETRDVAALGHDFLDPVITKEPTCTDSGIESGKCIRCSEETTNNISAKGHVYSEYTVTKEATCTAEGIKEGVCSVCSAKTTEKLPMTEHTYDDGVVKKEATETEEGLKVYTCTVCNGEREEAIPMNSPDTSETEPVITESHETANIPDTAEEPETTETPAVTTEAAPDTDDECGSTGLIIAIVIGAVAIAAATVALIKKRK